MTTPEKTLLAPHEPLDLKDYEIKWLKERIKQMHHRIAALEKQLRAAQLDPWAAGEGEV